MNLKYKKEIAGRYQVYRGNKKVGYLEKWDNWYGWVFFEDDDSEWFGGYETLKETKNWLTSLSGGEFVINKIVKY